MSLRPRSCSVSSLGERGGTCVSGVAMERVLDLQLHFAIFYPGLERLHRLKCRERLGPSAPQVEQGAVAGALHCTCVGVELTLGERTVVVRAAILDRVQVAVDAAKDPDLAPVGLHEAHLALGELVQPA